MPPKTAEVTVRPAVLKWARETAGYSPEDVARRLDIPTSRVVGWEGPGPARLTFRQLEELTRYYKRPTAALLLDEPPAEPPPPVDFRRPLHRDAPFSPELRLAVRRARRLQRLVRELMEAMEQALTSDIPQVNSQASAESVARELRKAFGITTRQQLGWKDPREAFRRWREALEVRRILVFQGDFPREEAQGFSLSDSDPYSIVVTQKKEEPFTARCFTLFHEYAHLLLREGGVCLTQEVPPSDGSSIARTENWCQRFAEAFLVDADVLRDRPETEAVLRRQPGYEHALQRLAFAFKVSQYVVLFRLWHLDLMPEARFWREYNRVREEAAEAARRREKRKEGGGGPPPAQRAVQERGRLFTRIVLEALEREMLSHAEVMEYLGVRPKHLEKVRLAVYG